VTQNLAGGPGGPLLHGPIQNSSLSADLALIVFAY